MKKLLFFLIVLTGLSVVSCRTDDKPEPVVEQGKWQPKTIQITKVVPLYTLDYPHSEGCSKDYLELNEDETAKFYHYEEGSRDEVTYENAFTRTGNQVNINVMGYAIEGEIVTETSTTMEIQSDISEYIPYIKIMSPEYEAYLDMLDGATVKLILDKKG